MVDFLASVFFAVNQKTGAFVELFFSSNIFCHREHSTEGRLMFWKDMVGARDYCVWDNKYMCRCLWIIVAKGRNEIILVDYVRLYLSSYDFGKYIILAHGPYSNFYFEFRSSVDCREWIQVGQII